MIVRRLPGLLVSRFLLRLMRPYWIYSATRIPWEEQHMRITSVVDASAGENGERCLDVRAFVTCGGPEHLA